MYSPFWNFFDSINNEVDQFNRILTNSGFQTPRRSITGNEKTKDGKQITKRSDNRNLAFPNLFSNSFFDSTFDVIPPIDVLDHEKEYELHVSIPGVEKEKINLDFNPEKNEIKIWGEIPGHTVEDEKLKLKERSSGKFTRVISLPTQTKLDEENIKAVYNNGVLVLTVPKLEKPKETTRRIAITAAADEEPASKL